MKMRFNLLNALLFVALASLISCGDDAAPAKTLITTSKWNGTFYSVNTKTGALTELFTPTLNGAPLTELRGLVYHPKEKKYYATSTYNGDGNVYSIDPATGEATIILENQGWYAVTGLTIADDNSLFAYVNGWYDSNDNWRTGFITIGTDGSWDNTIIDDFGDACCGLTMVNFSKENTILLSNADDQYDGELELFLYNEDGSIKRGISLYEFIGFDEVIKDYWWVARSMASATGSSKDPVYTILRNYSEDITYFAKIDLTKGTITKIANWDGDVDDDYAALTFVSPSVID